LPASRPRCSIELCLLGHRPTPEVCACACPTPCAPPCARVPSHPLDAALAHHHSIIDAALAHHHSIITPPPHICSTCTTRAPPALNHPLAPPHRALPSTLPWRVWQLRRRQGPHRRHRPLGRTPRLRPPWCRARLGLLRPIDLPLLAPPWLVVAAYHVLRRTSAQRSLRVAPIRTPSAPHISAWRVCL
jgi:hypothetical protein